MKNIIVGIFFGLLIVGAGLWFEWRFVTSELPAVDYSQLPDMDCGVVLTGSAGRLREAFEILAIKKVKRLIVSGVYRDARLDQLFPQLKSNLTVSVDDIILEKRSESTYGNAVQSSVVAEALHCKDIMLMTSQLHMPRSYKIFRRVFPENFVIYKAPLKPARTEVTFLDVLVESIKSGVYRILIPLL